MAAEDAEKSYGLCAKAFDCKDRKENPRRPRRKSYNAEFGKEIAECAEQGSWVNI